MGGLFCVSTNTAWWLTFPSEKIWVRQLGLLFPIYGKIKHVPNHQPNNAWKTMTNGGLTWWQWGEMGINVPISWKNIYNIEFIDPIFNMGRNIYIYVYIYICIYMCVYIYIFKDSMFGTPNWIDPILKQGFDWGVSVRWEGIRKARNHMEPQKHPQTLGTGNQSNWWWFILIYSDLLSIMIYIR